MMLARLSVAAVLVLVASASGALADGRVALVIGNSTYAHAGRLPNAENDATDMAAALRRLGFEVTTELDTDFAGLNGALRAFSRRSSGADVSLVFYAGHGMELDGVNHLLPVDARLEHDTDVRYETATLDDVLAATTGATLQVVILDACRDNPLARSIERTGAQRSIGRMGRGSFAELNEDLLGNQTLVAYAARAGTTAADGRGRNSPYTAALLEHLEQPLEIGMLFRRVRTSVLEATGGRQEPHDYHSLQGVEHYLSGRPPPPPPPPPERESLFWQSVLQMDTVAAYEEYEREYLNGSFVGLSRIRRAALSGDVDPPTVEETTPASVDPGRTYADGELFRDCAECPEMVVLAGGGLAMGRYEVTVGEYRAFVSATGGTGDDGWRGHDFFLQTDRHPVVSVSWDDAQAYVSWLSRRTGATYRLPSDAEWERAAAGWERAVAESQPICSTYGGTGNSGTCAVGSYDPNGAGLSDMVGNVWEWTSDCWGRDCGRRVLRGSSWLYDAPLGFRTEDRTGLRLVVNGFRVARTLD